MFDKETKKQKKMKRQEKIKSELYLKENYEVFPRYGNDFKYYIHGCHNIVIRENR